MNESLHEMAVRMRGGGHGYDCSNCPIRTEVKRVPCLICSLLCADNAEEQLDVLRKWAEEHPLPKKTWLNMFRESFPNAPKRGNGAPYTCPEVLYGSVAENRGCTNGCGCYNGDCFDCWSCYDGDCFDCWNREVPEDERCK